ncbi:unnamed protein product [Vitrella brassicaformis CCMP3155]|uniref:Major facilitator superfamily (MFS) profile domain-containing protein n=1 Tax=Vitrella brassicaformis (strain CCMP3155) TaxID=1169540 RepID=A0A0G4EDY0_VITBC|nr:unnamed protein product [Vitrella brassicaformis CCMP3155]|eukprot:CEL93552.1 unnamed protein product [Vitrella brassicaformis CCMP3155]
MTRPEVHPRRQLHVSVLTIGFLYIFLESFTHTLIIPMVPQVLPHLTHTAYSILISSRAFATVFLVLPAGALTDRVGWRRLLMLPLLLQMAGAVMFFAYPNYGLYLMARVVQGIASSFGNVVALTGAASTHTEENRGAAFGVVLMGDFGYSVGSTLGGILFDAGGHRLLFGVLLMIIVSFSALVILLVPCLPPDLQQEGGAAEGGEGRSEKGEVRERGGGDDDLGLLAMARNFHLNVTLYGIWCGWGCFMASLSWMPRYWEKELRFSATRAGVLLNPATIARVPPSLPPPIYIFLCLPFLLSVSGLHCIPSTQLLAAPVMGFLVSYCRLPPQLALACANLLCGVSSLLLLAFPSAIAQACILALQGWGTAAVDSGGLVTVVKIVLEERGVGRVGTGYALEDVAYNGGIIWGPIIVGGVVHLTDDYWLGFFCMALLAFTGSALVFYSWSTYLPPPARSPSIHPCLSEEDTEGLLRRPSHHSRVTHSSDDSGSSPSPPVSKRNSYHLRVMDEDHYGGGGGWAVLGGDQRRAVGKSIHATVYGKVQSTSLLPVDENSESTDSETADSGMIEMATSGGDGGPHRHQHAHHQHQHQHDKRVSLVWSPRQSYGHDSGEDGAGGGGGEGEGRRVSRVRTQRLSVSSVLLSSGMERRLTVQ